jgi:DNA-binding NarL/FixJ family response regulator
MGKPAWVAVPVRVLVVDDQPSFRELAGKLLHRRGYIVVGEASCSASAIDAARRLEPDAVLLDVRLGDESGFEVAWALRQACPRAAVLLVSAQDFGHCREHLRSCGACGFLLKSRLVSVDLATFWPSADEPTR